MGSKQTLTAAEASRLTDGNGSALLNTVVVEPVSLAVFDDLLTKEETAA
jgi:hypothetical protein